jgi:hypothetical protein
VHLFRNLLTLQVEIPAPVLKINLPAALFLQEAFRQIGGDRINPCFEGRLASKGVKVFRKLDIGLLKDVFAVLAVGQQAK